LCPWPSKKLHSSSMRLHARQRAAALYLLVTLFRAAAGETLSRHGDAVNAVAVGGHGNAEALPSTLELADQGRQPSVMRRERLMEHGESLQDLETREWLSRGSSEEGTRRFVDALGRRVIRRRSRTGSAYSLWANVTNFTGQLCMENKTRTYDIKQSGTEEARNIQACMDHCEATMWCSTMSYHGDPDQMTAKNVCVISGTPCEPISGTNAAIANANDDNWFTMNYTWWDQVPSMLHKHCDPTGELKSQSRPNVNSLDECLALCENVDKLTGIPTSITNNASTTSWCKFANYETATNNCDMLSKCNEIPDAAGSLGFEVFQKGNRDTVNDDADDDTR